MTDSKKRLAGNFEINLICSQKPFQSQSQLYLKDQLGEGKLPQMGRRFQQSSDQSNHMTCNTTQNNLIKTGTSVSSSQKEQDSKKNLENEIDFSSKAESQNSSEQTTKTCQQKINQHSCFIIWVLSIIIIGLSGYIIFLHVDQYSFSAEELKTMPVVNLSDNCTVSLINANQSNDTKTMQDQCLYQTKNVQQSHLKDTSSRRHSKSRTQVWIWDETWKIRFIHDFEMTDQYENCAYDEDSKHAPTSKCIDSYSNDEQALSAGIFAVIVISSTSALLILIALLRYCITGKCDKDSFVPILIASKVLLL